MPPLFASLLFAAAAAGSAGTPDPAAQPPPAAPPAAEHPGAEAPAPTPRIRRRPDRARILPTPPISADALGKPLLKVTFDLPGITGDERAQLTRFLSDLEKKPLTLGLVQTITKRLASVRRYRSVQCNVPGDDAVVACAIVRARVLRAVKVEGLPAAILETDVLKRVFLRPGEPLDESDNTGKSRIARQRLRIIEFLEREGYMGSEVSMLVHRSPVPGEYDLVIRVRGGSFVRVRRVLLKSFGPLSQRELQNAYGRMCLNGEGLLDGVFTGNIISCFNKRRLTATTDRFVDRLHELGYPEARIHVEPVFVNPRRSDDEACALSPHDLDDLAAHGLPAPPQCVDLVVDVEQGTQVTARFHVASKKQKPIVEMPDFFGSTILWVRETVLEPTSRMLQIIARAPPSTALDTQLVQTRLHDTLSFEDAAAVDDTEVAVSAQNAEKYLGQRGRIAPRIGVEQEEFPGERVVDFTIAPSPVAAVRTVRFVGNQSVTSEEIEKNTDLAAHVRSLGNSGTVSNAQLADDEDRIRTFYAQRGFPEANVQAVAELSPPGAIDVTFVIDEGERFTVSGVVFAGGAPSLTAEVLKAIKNCQGGAATLAHRDPKVPADCRGAPLQPDELEADAQRVQQVYATHGYPDVDASIETAFQPEGTVLRILVLPPGASGGLRADPRPGNVKQAVLGAVFLEGNERTRRDVLLREAGLDGKVGKPLDPIALGKGISRLRRSGLFSSVELQYLGLDGSFGDNRTAIRLSVDERPAFTVDSSVGYSTEQLFSLRTEVRHRNLFGTMLDADGLIDFGLFIGRLSQTRAQLRWPRILGSDIDASFVPLALTYYDTPAGVRLTTPSTTAGQQATAAWAAPDLRRRLFSAGGSLSVDWRVQNVWAPINDKLTLKVALELRYDFLNPAAKPIAPLSQEAFQTIDGLTTVLSVDPTRVAALTPSLSFSNIDNLFDPHNGVALELFVRASSPPFVENGPFGVVGGAARGYLTLFDRLTLAGSVRTSIGVSADVSCPTSAPCEWALMQNDLLLLGGERSVRGVPENQIGVLGPVFDSRLKPVPEVGPQLIQVRPGLYGAVVNAELRYTLVRRFFIGALVPAVFFDGGVSTDDFENIDLFPAPGSPIDLRTAWSVGAGLRIATPVGPLSFDYAWSPPRNTAAGYITFGYLF